MEKTEINAFRRGIIDGRRRFENNAAAVTAPSWISTPEQYGAWCLGVDLGEADARNSTEDKGEA